MCDYSLQTVRSRPAKVGEKLKTRHFNTGTIGFAAPEDCNTAVCVLPGTELAFAKAVSCRPHGLLGWKPRTLNHTTAIFGKSISTTREPIMMPWNFLTGEWCC